MTRLPCLRFAPNIRASGKSIVAVTRSTIHFIFLHFIFGPHRHPRASIYPLLMQLSVLLSTSPSSSPRCRDSRQLALFRIKQT
ncbi:hypothetical protein BC567DRAFT_90553 [Phyllosticta citribraziliensis]